MLVYVAWEWAKVRVKEISRRLHCDPPIISRLYAAYALARRRPDFSTVSYFTPRATLSTSGRVEFCKTRHRCANRFKAVGKPSPRHPGPEMVGSSHKVACSSAVARCIFHVWLPVAPSMPRVRGLARFGTTGDVDQSGETPCSFRRNPR